MPDILIRNVPAKTVDALKTRARRHRRSLQAEALATLERAVEPLGDGLVAWLENNRPDGLDARHGIAAIRAARDER